MLLLKFKKHIGHWCWGGGGGGGGGSQSSQVILLSFREKLFFGLVRSGSTVGLTYAH